MIINREYEQEIDLRDLFFICCTAGGAYWWQR